MNSLVNSMIFLLSYSELIISTFTTSAGRFFLIHFKRWNGAVK